jgi:hypothetical protein
MLERPWPNGKDFAFTIFDDTDFQTVHNGAPIYALLADLGFRTTKSVWPIRGHRTPTVGGATCEEERYLKWVLSLQDQGFEIGLHNVTYHTSTRSDTVRGFDAFRRLFGHDPYSMANHTDCHEAMYWGNYRLSGLNADVYNLLHRNRYKDVFQGHVERSALFWGDVCKQKVKYMRNFVFRNINTLKMCPFMPYHDPERPYVNYWFASSEGPTVTSFNSMLKEDNQDRLQRERGACIMYTHFACGFIERGHINQRFKMLMERLSKMNGWFVPVSTLLDFILQSRYQHVGCNHITSLERNNLERKWLWDKLVHASRTT